MKRKRQHMKTLYLAFTAAVFLAVLWAVPVMAGSAPAHAGAQISAENVHSLTIQDSVACSDGNTLVFDRDFAETSGGERFYFADMKIAAGSPYYFAPVTQEGWTFTTGDISGTAPDQDLVLVFHYTTDLTSEEVTYDYSDDSYIPESRTGKAVRTLQFEAVRNGEPWPGITLKTESPIALGKYPGSYIPDSSAEEIECFEESEPLSFVTGEDGRNNLVTEFPAAGEPGDTAYYTIPQLQLSSTITMIYNNGIGTLKDPYGNTYGGYSLYEPSDSLPSSTVISVFNGENEKALQASVSLSYEENTYYFTSDKESDNFWLPDTSFITEYIKKGYSLNVENASTGATVVAELNATYVKPSNPGSTTKPPVMWQITNNGRRYIRPDGTYPINMWECVNSTWYYFNKDGYCVRGWQYLHGKWYYMNSAGAMQTGWQKIDGSWYYFDSSGAMQTGWLRLGTTWYFLDSSGAMKTGWVQTGGSWYYFAPSGAMKTGWLKNGSSWYFLKDSGAMQTGWLLDGKTWYFLDGSGAMKTGWVQTGGSWYYLESSGAMMTGWFKQGSTWYYLTGSGAMKTGWLLDGSTWYYFNSSGKMQTGWLKQGRNWYFLTGSGAMKTGWFRQGSWYYFRTDGTMATGWYLDKSTWYYANSGGAMQTGWLRQGNTWYYLTGSGAMATGWYQVGGTWYYADKSGKMLTGWIKDGSTWYYLASSGAMEKNRWIGNYYVGSSGAMYESRFTPDGFYVDNSGQWLPISGSEFKQDGLHLVSSYFYLTLPESWVGKASYYAEKDFWGIWYNETASTAEGEISADILDVFAFNTKSESLAGLTELENSRQLGQHAGRWFISGNSTSDTIDISIFTQEQQEEIQKLREEASSILNSIVFR